jgi:DNA-binding FrmR family transcriptional regulator
MNKHTPRPDSQKRDLIIRLHRIQGQLEGIEHMIEEDRYCMEVLNQLAAAQKGLEAVSLKVLETHMKTCMKEELLEGDDQAVDRVLELVRKAKI